jgi:PAS domain S-box-containing protein
VCRVSFSDITEQKEAEVLLQRHDDLEKEKENIQQYLDFAPVVFLLLDPKGKVQMINQKGCQLLGYKNHEILGKNWFENFMGKVLANRLNTSVFNVEHVKQPIPPYFESTLFSKNNIEHVIAWTSVSLDRKGTFLGTLMAGEDITDRKLVEQQKQKYTDDLEKIVEERTKELTEALHNQKIINEMKSAFVSMASHEFRTPLTSIMSSAILIEKYNSLYEYDKEKRHVERIKLSVKRLTDILEDFLSLDKLERGLLTSKKEAFDISLFTKDIIEEYEWMLKEGQNIYYEHKGDPSVFFDQNILRNIFSNLISNAIKYSDADVALYTRVNNKQLHIDLLDKGIGIPEDDQKYLFSKFFRAKNVTSIQGTGLGLSIVKHYIDLLGGSIEFTSKLGEGSNFKIVLPLRL